MAVASIAIPSGHNLKRLENRGGFDQLENWSSYFVARQSDDNGQAAA